MSKFFVVSAFGCGVGVWRLLDVEGHDVTVHIGQKSGGPLLSHRYVGDGIVDKIDSWIKLCDEARSFHENVGDTVVLFDSSGLGEKADEMRDMGIPVVGGGRFCDRLEKERDFAMTMMKRNGCDIPDYQIFPSLTETINHVFQHRKKGILINGKVHEKVYFKANAYLGADATRSADNPEDLIRFLRHIRRHCADKRINMLQESIDGPAVSTARWWNGTDWVGPYEGTLERKKTFAEEIGPSTGCSINAVWFYPEETPLIAKALKWDGLTEFFRAYDAPPGLYDINAVLKDGKAWFLEWTPRFGWDSEGTSIPLLYQSFPDWLNYIAHGKKSNKLGLSNKLAYGIRLGVPPYPWEDSKRDQLGSAVGIGIWGPPTSLGEAISKTNGR